MARRSFGEDYECKKDWDDDCFCQCGGKGLVVSNEGDSYTTAFFEVFNKNPDTFIRGEGNTVEEAEENAWNKLQIYKDCKGHEFERRGYTNRAGFCKHCGLFVSKYFKPSTKCKICGEPTNWTYNKYDEWYCKKHTHLIPYEEMNDYRKRKFDNSKTERITTLNDFMYSEDREYYLKHNNLEMRCLDNFMTNKFKELSNELGFDDVTIANIKEKYIFAVKNCPMSISMFASKHEYIGNIEYKENRFHLISLIFNELKEVSEEDSDENIYEKTGRTIYLFSLETDSLKRYIEKNE